jgi:glucose-6-phosphate 1-dehydrogenase
MSSPSAFSRTKESRSPSARSDRERRWTVTVQANFSYQASFGSKGPVAYETLLLDSMRGDATLFTRRDEVEAEWRIITPIEEAWARLPAPSFPNYNAGSEGPASWHELVEVRGNAAEQTIGHGES